MSEEEKRLWRLLETALGQLHAVVSPSAFIETDEIKEFVNSKECQAIVKGKVT